MQSPNFSARFLAEPKERLMFRPKSASELCYQLLKLGSDAGFVGDGLREFLVWTTNDRGSKSMPVVVSWVSSYSRVEEHVYLHIPRWDGDRLREDLLEVSPYGVWRYYGDIRLPIDFGEDLLSDLCLHDVAPQVPDIWYIMDAPAYGGRVTKIEQIFMKQLLSHGWEELVVGGVPFVFKKSAQGAYAVLGIMAGELKDFGYLVDGLGVTIVIGERLSLGEVLGKGATNVRLLRQYLHLPVVVIGKRRFSGLVNAQDKYLRRRCGNIPGRLSPFDLPHLPAWMRVGIIRDGHKQRHFGLTCLSFVRGSESFCAGCVFAPGDCLQEGKIY